MLYNIDALWMIYYRNALWIILQQKSSKNHQERDCKELKQELARGKSCCILNIFQPMHAKLTVIIIIYIYI